MLKFSAARHKDVHFSLLSICSNLLTPAFACEWVLTLSLHLWTLAYQVCSHPTRVVQRSQVFELPNEIAKDLIVQGQEGIEVSSGDLLGAGKLGYDKEWLLSSVGVISEQ